MYEIEVLSSQTSFNLNEEILGKMFTRVCCCDIKTAVLVLTILTMISNGFSAILLVLAVRS